MTNHFLQILIPLLSFTTALLLPAAAQLPAGFILDFQGKSIAAGEYVYQGDAQMVQSPPSVRLTGVDASNYPVQNSVGRVVWSDPIQFSSAGQQLNFESVLRFFITPVDREPSDGLTFFIAPVGTQIPQGSAGGHLGVFGPDGSNSNTLVIEFDSGFTYEYDGGASVMAHVGIDIGSPRSVNFTELGSAMISQEVTATIRYEHSARLITVTVATGNQIFVVSHVRDLSTLLTPQAQIGISAATGRNVAVHSLLFWEFRPISYVPTSSTQVV